MRNSSSDANEEKLKSAYQSAKKARKKAKSNYKAKERELKGQLKPFKKLWREAEKQEALARVAYKDRDETTPAEVQVITVEPPTEPRKRGRQPGYSPKAAQTPVAAPTPSPAKTKGDGDKLSKVKGVGDNISTMLKANGIKTYADMANTSFERYKELLKANGMSKFRDPSEWAARAAVLASLPVPVKAAPKPPVEPRKRGRQPGYSPKAAQAAAAASTSSAKTKGDGDKLAKVKGVGDNISTMLKANGIKTYADMANTSFERYKELLKANGMSKFRDPSEWAARAAVLASLPVPAKPAPKPEVAAEPRKRGRQPGYSPKAAKAAAEASGNTTATATTAKAVAEPASEPRKRGRQPGYSPNAAKAAAAAPVAAPTPAPVEAAPKAPAKPKGPPAKPDDLTQVKGVGQRVAEALNKEGIYTYKDMAGVSLDRYKEILKDNSMSKFRDPSDWAKVAGELAAKK